MLIFLQSCTTLHNHTCKNHFRANTDVFKNRPELLINCSTFFFFEFQLRENQIKEIDWTIKVKGLILLNHKFSLNILYLKFLSTSGNWAFFERLVKDSNKFWPRATPKVSLKNRCWCCSCSWRQIYFFFRRCIQF